MLTERGFSKNLRHFKGTRVKSYFLLVFLHPFRIFREQLGQALWEWRQGITPSLPVHGDVLSATTYNRKLSIHSLGVESNHKGVWSDMSSDIRGVNLQQSTALCPQSRSVSVRKSRISACSRLNAKQIVSSRPLAQDYVYRRFYNSHSPHASIAFILCALLVNVATPRRVLSHLLSRTCESHFTDIS